MRCFSPADLAAWMFEGKISGREIRVSRNARRGESIYPQYSAFERAMRGRKAGSPGAVLIYSGHNDTSSARGLPFLFLFREEFLCRSWLLSDLFFSAEKRFPQLRARTLDTYAYYLRRIVELSLEKGLTPVLSTVVSNLADMDPGLFPSPELPLSRIGQLLEEGRRLEAAGRRREAIAFYSRAGRTHPRLSRYMRYLIGGCLREMGEYKAAMRYFYLATEGHSPDNFGRARPWQNGYIRSLAAVYSAPLADTEELFRRRSPNGVIGGELFADGHHPNMDGYLLLAEAYASALSGAFNEPVRRRYRGPADMAAAFSCDNFKQSDALMGSGQWLFSVAARHARPERRLKLARDRFKEALKLDPHNLDAWIGLGMTEAALRSGPGSKEECAAWPEKYGFFRFRGGRGDTKEERDALVRKFLPCGVPAEIVERVSAEAASPYRGRGYRPQGN